ncbi:MAG: hypothetical protein L0K41_10210 [Yaniella sp.]|uniref:hypothetical protein n=1 Tax=Yaniella sp. TaxID=2773929 RepID=UPI0026491C02|nr:hypothetical protein [Yaniella sp.]MDN5732457.1 hypothetical protein [Yaniella sp.]MDN5817824.1 hypothetical protein [Yaniella sp.]MDN6457572.1 hypothetical protein [Yaniella sp.]MDN6490758.1 hypothetical protein [Yaniella sp.]
MGKRPERPKRAVVVATTHQPLHAFIPPQHYDMTPRVQPVIDEPLEQALDSRAFSTEKVIGVQHGWGGRSSRP